MYDETKDQIDAFIYRTFAMFAQNKQEIYINIFVLKNYLKNDGWMKFLFGKSGLKTREYNSIDKNNYFIPSDDTNLLTKDIIDLFPNITSLRVDFVQFDGEYWSFSLLQLLKLVNNTKIEQVKLNAIAKNKGESTWLSYLWETSSAELKVALNEEGWYINFYDQDGSDEFQEINISKQYNKK